MTLQDEISRLRAEFESKRLSESSSKDGAKATDGAECMNENRDAEIGEFLDTVNTTLDEFAGEIDKYPRLTAIAALGVGLAIGLVIGRQIR